MYATSRPVRLVSAALAVVIGSTLLLAKARFSDEYTRLAARHDVVVLPVAEVIGARSARLAAMPEAPRAN